MQKRANLADQPDRLQRPDQLRLPVYYAQTMFADSPGDQMQLVRLLTRILAHHGTVR